MANKSCYDQIDISKLAKNVPNMQLKVTVEYSFELHKKVQEFGLHFIDYNIVFLLVLSV
jgi:hypothetical protein